MLIWHPHILVCTDLHDQLRLWGRQVTSVTLVTPVIVWDDGFGVRSLKPAFLGVTVERLGTAMSPRLNADRTLGPG